MNNLKEFLKRPAIKNVFLGVLTLIIGALCSSLGDWKTRDDTFWLKVTIVIIFTIIYVVLLVFYSTAEVNDRRTMEILKNRVSAFEAIMVGLLEIMCFNNASLGNNEKEIVEIASKYFVPYSYLILLLHKLEKSLLAKPNGDIE